MKPVALYVHIPFCARKCAYCDFNAYSGMGDLAARYASALIADLRRSAEAIRGRPVTSVFFGGGTPTFLAGEDLARILAAVRELCDLATDAEITSEANPSSSDAQRFSSMRQAGFNRLSIGVQALDDNLLRAADREHTAEEAEAAVRAARQTGFRNVSIDLMFGLPGQTMRLWIETLQRAAALGTEHLSVYALTLEPGTRFERLHAGGRLALPDEDTQAEMYEAAEAILELAGLEHYEISNYARPGYRSRHNLGYWANAEYLGIGAGAVSYLAGRRCTRQRHPAAYLRAAQRGEEMLIESETLAPEARLGESLMLGLRIREGVSIAKLRDETGIDAQERLAAPIAQMLARGLLAVDGDRMSLTPAGRLLSNEVVMALLP